MIDTLDIGSVPYAENCGQLGPGYDPRKAKLECERFIAAIKLKCGEPPAGAKLVITSNHHDFGTYHEVAVKYNDQIPEAVDYAFKVESQAPEYWKFEHNGATYDFTPRFELLPEPEAKFWLSPVPEKCDLCPKPIIDTFVDGGTVIGPWGCMCPDCHRMFGRGLGLGQGQKYVKQPDGRFRKTEG